MGFVPRVTQRRWALRKHRRGVSPIIATILLVAITVALAATLYVLLLPLISHPTSPIGSNLSWGTVTPHPGYSQPGNPACTVGHYCWSVTVYTANGGVTPSSLQLYVQNASQLTISTAAWTFTFLTSTNSIAASAPGPVAGGSGASWSGNASGNVLPLTDTLWIDTGSSTSFTGQSIVLWTAGTGGFSGSFSISLST